MTATVVKERPILMSAPMVCAILDDRKKHTRRVIKPQPRGIEPEHDGNGLWAWWRIENDKNAWDDRRCPYGRPGDRLWVRESFDIVDDPAARLPDEPPSEIAGYDCPDAVKRGPNNERWVVDYRATPPSRIMDTTGQRRWRPSIHMPRWASRITLEVTSVRVEKIQDLDGKWDDIRAEGFRCDLCDGGYCRACFERFRELWDHMNKDRGFGWDVNPWVWVVEFTNCKTIGSKVRGFLIMKVTIKENECHIVAENPDDRLMGHFAERIIEARDKEFAEFLEEVRVALRKLQPGESTSLQSRPIEVQVTKDFDETHTGSIGPQRPVRDTEG